MKTQKRFILAIFVAGMWVNASEFFRNQILLLGQWNEHYQSIGMVFPTAPVNAIVWVLWGFALAAMIYILGRRFSLIETTLVSWALAFPMMWLVIWNLNVLPISILAFAIPLSLLECFLGAYLCHKISPR